MITKIFSLLLPLYLLIQVFSFLQAQNIVTVHPEPYPDALRNPLMGFRPDPGDIGNADYPYTTIVRKYIRWNEIENDESDGVQKIIDFCNKEWAGYEKANVKVIPRVYVQWYTDPAGRYWPADLTDGDWTSQEFKDRVVNLIYKLGEAWDNDPRVAWVQTGIIGYWGEQESPVGVDEDGWAQRLGDAYQTAFKNKKLLVRNQNDWTSTEFGVYWDSYGHPGQKPWAWTDIKNFNSQGRYKTQIVEGEVAYGWGEDVFDPLYGGEPEVTLDDYKYTNNMIDVIRELHCTGLGWVASYMEIDPTSVVNVDSIRKNAARMQKEFGYRFLLPEFSCPSRVDQSQNMSINFKVKNLGSAAFYENWPVAFVLVDEATGAIVWKEILPNVDIRNWLPGDGYSYTTKAYTIPAQDYSIDASFTVPENIPTGQYLASISILEPTTQTPGVFFAVKNFIATNQTQPLCRISIGEDYQGDYNVTAVNDDPLLDDARYYSSSTDNFNVSISYPKEGASITPKIEIPVYVSAFNNGGTIDSVQLYVNGILKNTSFSSPYIFSLPNLPSDVYSIEVRAYDDNGTMKSDTKTFTVQFSGGVPWVEQFNFPNGTKSDNGSTAWTSKRGGGVFEVRNEAFEVSNGKGFIGELTTGVIKTYGAPVTVSLDVKALDAGLDAEDYIELYKIVDGVKTLIDRVVGYQSKTFTQSNIIGNEVQFVINGYVTFISEVYNFDNLSVTYDVQPETRYLTLNVNGNGMINPSAGVYPYYKNAEAYLIATPSFGYKFDQWSGDYTGTTNPATVLMDTSKSITANFTELPKYSLSVSAENGTVSLSTTAESYYEGTKLTLTASPNEGYKFFGWSGDLSGSINPASITMTENKSVSAIFVEIPRYTITASIENGTITLDPPDGNYLEGTKVKMTVIPNQNFLFSNWSGDHSGAENPTTITMDADKTVTAVIISVPSYTLTINAINGTVNYTPNNETYLKGAIVFFTAIPDFGFKFAGWEGDLNSTENPTSIIMNADKNITALFDIESAVDELSGNIPGQYSLEQNYPNPFSYGTTIPYQLNKASHVRLSVYNFLGEKVAVLVDQYQQPGYYKLDWDAKNQNGNYLTDGIYFCRLEIDTHSVHTKMTVVSK